MGIIRNHLQQMKEEDQQEYDRLMDGYKNESELIHEVLGLTKKAVSHYNYMKEEGKKLV